MSEENKAPLAETESNASLDDLAEFSVENEAAVTLDDEKVVLAEDLEGFAKGFPKWDLLPPKK